jgi:hypothetical protein
MKSILRYLVILSLLVVALPSILSADNSNVASAATVSDTPITMVTASSGWIIAPAPVPYTPPSFSSFYTCVFGVSIFPGSDPVGAYSVNVNTGYVPDKILGKVSGHMYIGPTVLPISGVVFYLKDKDNGASGSYFATANQGYYEIDHVPFGNYDVYTCEDEDAMHAGRGDFVSSISITTSNPNAVADWHVPIG